jgi:TRAP transporter TAXI family solute receptor
MKLVIAAAAAATLVSTAALAQEEQRFVTIGTGGVTGVYYPAGGAICRLVNRGRSEHGLRCSAESTGGSIYNLNTLQAGELDFGVVQSDWQYHAYNGSSEFSDKPFENVRAVFSLHPEPFTVMVQADSDIQNFEDIKGKRVNVGNPGSGQRATMEVLMDALGWTMDDFALATELKPAEMAQALCDGNIDVMIYTVGHPAAAIQEAVNSCDVRLINVTGEAIEKLVEDNPYYRIATVPGGMYKGTDAEITTFGVGATVVSSADVPDDVVYVTTKAVFDNLDQFKQLHPAFQVLKEEEMIKDGLSAPLHPGAERYYKERGWM